jgi:hypothetical protein
MHARVRTRTHTHTDKYELLQPRLKLLHVSNISPTCGVSDISKTHIAHINKFSNMNGISNMNAVLKYEGLPKL